MTGVHFLISQGRHHFRLTCHLLCLRVVKKRSRAIIANNKMMADYLTFSRKSQESLAVAKYCFEQGYDNSCVNRAYYAMFQIAVAALAKVGVTPSTKRVEHEWVHGEFSRAFIWQRKRFPKLKGLLSEVQEWRNTADYTDTEISHKKAKRLLDKAILFVEQVHKEVHHAS